jgi:hypothetical protein
VPCRDEEALSLADARSFELDDRCLVEVLRFEGEADPTGQPASPFGSLDGSQRERNHQSRPLVPLVSKRFIGVAILLAAVGCFALVVGGHDVFVAHGLDSRLFGALLAVAGLIMLIAAFGVFRRAEWHVALSLVGSFAALLVGAALLLAQLDAGERSPLLLVWVGVIAAALVALALSLGPGAPQVSTAVRRVQLVAVAGIILGVAQFVFTTVYGPATAGPHIEVTSTLERIGEKKGVVAVKAQVTLTNLGQRKVTVIDSIFRVTGQDIRKRPLASDTSCFRRRKDPKRQPRVPKNGFCNMLEPVAESRTLALGGFVARRGSAEKNGEAVASGQVLERGWFFEPRESFRREFIVHVPAGRYDLLRVFTHLAIAEHGRIDTGAKPVFGPKKEVREYSGNKYLVVTTAWDVRETSLVRRLIRGHSILWSTWLLAGPFNDPSLPGMVDYVDHEGQKFDPVVERIPDRVQHLSEEYGLLNTYSRAELSLFPAD